MRRFGMACLGLTLAMSAAACGSTVQLRPGAVNAGGAGGGGAATTGDPGAVTGDPGAAASGPTTDLGATGDLGTPGTGTPGTGTAASVPGSAATGGGFAGAPAAGSGTAGAVAVGPATGNTGSRAAPGTTAARPGVATTQAGRAPVRSAAAPGKGGGAAGSGAAAPGRPVAPGGGAAPSGPGVTATEIFVGTPYAKNADQTNAAAGAGGITHGDEKAITQIVIDDINAHGGVAGRKLVAVPHALDPTSAESTDSQYAAACQDFTVDHKVFAAFGPGPVSYVECLRKAGVAFIDADLPLFDSQLLAQYPNTFELGYPNLDRAAALLPTALNAQNYFTPWDNTNGAPAAAGAGKPVVGIITFGSPYSQFQRIATDVLKPALERMGLQVVPVETVPPAVSQSDIAPFSAAVSSAELKFKSEGVTHVLPVDHNAALTLFFMNAAGGQHYRPRYGGNTGNAFQTLVDSGAIQDAGQFNGAVGYSWNPILDLAAADNKDDGPYSNDLRRACFNLMQAHGQNAPDANARAIQLLSCDGLRFLQQMANSAASGGAPLTLASFTGAVERSGSAFQSNAHFGMNFGPGRHDGPSAVYYEQYTDACKCIRYVGAPHPVP